MTQQMNKRRQIGVISTAKLLVLLIVVSLVAGTYWLAAYINQQQASVAEWVSEQLGYPVEIGNATLSWRDYSPKVALESVKVLGETQAQPLLTLSALYLDLNFYQSLLEQRLRLDNVTINGLKLGVIRDENGGLSLQGLNQQGDSTPLFAELLVKSDALDSFNVEAIVIDYYDRSQPILTGRYNIEQAEIKHTLNKWQASGAIVLPTRLGKGVQFDVDWYLNTEQPELTTWSWQLELDDVLLDHVRQYLVWEQLIVKQGRADLALSAKGTGTRIHTVNGNIAASRLHLANSQAEFEPVIFDTLSAQANWQQQNDHWLLSVNQFQFESGEQTWPNSTFQIKRETEQTHVEGSYINIEQLLNIAQLTATLPEQLLQQRSSGQLRQFQLSIDDNNEIDTLAFELKQGSVKSWRDYPGIDNIDADVKSANGITTIALASRNIMVELGHGLDEPLFFDQLSGQVTIEQLPDSALSLTSQNLQISNSDLMIKLNGRSQRDTQGNINNDLQIDLANVALARWKSYVPQSKLEPDFKKWSKNAFQSGLIKQGTIKLAGDLAAFPYDTKATEQLGSFDLAMQVENVHLHYADDWPDLYDITGSISGKGNNLIIESQQANIAGYNIDQVRVDINKLLEAKPILTTKGLLTGTTQQGLNFLQNTPLKKRFGDVAKQIAARGNNQIDLALTVPLSNSVNTDVKGTITFLNNRLSAKSSKLALNQVKGKLNFNNDGVSANNIRARWLGEPVKITVKPQGDKAVISANSIIPIAKLQQQWPQSFPNFVQGNVPLQLDVIVAERQPGDFYMDIALLSDLKGTEVSLPAPFTKTTNQAVPFKVVFKQSQQQPVYQLDYGQQKAVITPNRSDALSLADGDIQATLSDIDIEAWQSWSEQQNSNNSNVGFKTFELNTQKVTGFGQQWSSLSLTGLKEKAAWQLKITSPDIRGQIDVDEELSSIDARLSKLKIVLPESDKPATSISQTLWPSANIVIDDLHVDEMKLGNFKLSANNTGQAWVIDQARLQAPYYQAELTGRWTQDQQTHNTTMSLKVESDDIEQLLTALNYQAGLEAKESKLYSTLSWSGSPIDFDKAKANGTFGFKLKKGKLNEVEPGAAGRVFGLLSIAAIPRRLSLDFNELFGKGFNFRRLKGDFNIANGIADTKELSLRGEAADIDITGTIDINNEQYNQRVKVRPNVSSTLPAAGAVAGGPVGLGVGTAIFLADKLAEKLFDTEIVNVISYDYQLTGSWQDPQLDLLLPKPAR